MRGVVLKSAWRLARGYLFHSRRRGLAWLLVLSVIALNLAAVYVAVQINLWHADFYNIIQERTARRFVYAIGVYAMLAAALVFIRGVQVYLRLKLHISWREWLTDKYLTQWLKNKIYYHLQLDGANGADNPDQRISEDVDLFVSLSLKLFLECMQDGLMVASFIVILWRLSGVFYISIGGVELAVYGYLVWAALLYASIGTVLTVIVGKPLVELDYRQQKCEADFRYSLLRIREYAESIALYGGESAERRGCGNEFGHLANNFLRIITVRKYLTWLTSSYAYTAVVFAILVASPQYFSGRISLGNMFQIIDAFHQVQSGLSVVIDSFTRIAQWRAVVNRLNNFLAAMVKAVDGGKRGSLRRRVGNDRRLGVEALTVYRPDGKILVAGLNLTIAAGQKVIVVGPSGCGKSTLLKTLAGLWPHADGTASVPLPSSSLFVPQKAYMPIDTLKRVLAYPQNLPLSAAAIEQALQLCRISHLTPLLELHDDWGRRLSLGEQQRVAFARLLLQRPKWIFLDEATSALDDANQALMYSLLNRYLPDSAVVSVAHRQSVAEYHDRRLILDGNGGWRYQDNI